MRIVIAEDTAILREGLAQLLGMRGHEVVAAVGTPVELLAAVATHRPAVAVIDIRMPPTHTEEGLRAALDLRKQDPTLGVLLFSQYVETRFVSDLLAGGSSGVGYLLKERVTDLDEFTAALERVAAGGTALDPEVVTQLFGAGRRDDGLATLTPREREVLSLMAEGRTNAAIARALVVTDRAIEKHVANIFQKLGLSATDGDQHRRVVSVLRYLDGR
ncbi:MAG TPA: response regulator transcription factor [Pseudonocardiaceae bacterium]|jgi:DNA-binding NarL/FixJ family response regulator|nr:response regulator transcription factor [Pseudonocardiaceae bacterium]